MLLFLVPTLVRFALDLPGVRDAIQIPNDPLPPLKSSGIRIGTPAMTSKGWKEEEFVKLAEKMMEHLKSCEVIEN